MWSNPHVATGLVTFTEEILNGKLHILCSVITLNFVKFQNIKTKIVYVPIDLYVYNNDSCFPKSSMFARIRCEICSNLTIGTPETLKTCNLFKKRLQQRYFPVKIL